VPDSIVAIKSFPRRWAAAFALLDAEDDDVLRRRPGAGVWSALEYLAHTRDAIAVNAWAMNETLVKDHPVLEWPGSGDPSAPADDDPISTTPDAATGLAELTANTERVVAKAERTDAGDWHRGATLRGGRDEEVDALWFLHHVVHEGVHHLRDVQRGLQQVRAGTGR
jgi:uncharacterized damage-inducible protein DinB